MFELVASLVVFFAMFVVWIVAPERSKVAS